MYTITIVCANIKSYIASHLTWKEWCNPQLLYRIVYNQNKAKNRHWSLQLANKQTCCTWHIHISISIVSKCNLCNSDIKHAQHNNRTNQLINTVQNLPAGITFILWYTVKLTTLGKKVKSTKTLQHSSHLEWPFPLVDSETQKDYQYKHKTFQHRYNNERRITHRHIP